MIVRFFRRGLDVILQRGRHIGGGGDDPAEPGHRGNRQQHVGDLIFRSAYIHTDLDDHSRAAYAEIHDDETSQTATAVLRNAVAWFAERSVRIERVLSGNGSCYRSHLWRDTCTELGVSPKRTQPCRPQTNGKLERFHPTLADGWA